MFPPLLEEFVNWLLIILAGCGLAFAALVIGEFVNSIAEWFRGLL
jgi:hypothetical protein